MKGQDKTTLWVGWPNLKVIMKYNKSPMYAIATAELAKAIYKKWVMSSLKSINIK